MADPDFIPVEKKGDPDFIPAQGATIGVNRGPAPIGSPGYQFSKGYQGENDAQRDSGGFIDRVTTQAGRALNNPRNFIPSWTSLLGPLDPTPTVNAYHEFQAARSGAPAEDPAKRLGNQAPAALTALVMHAADAAPNLGEAAGSEMVPSGVAHPVQAVTRGVKALPRPNLVSAVKDPLGSVGKAVADIPKAGRAALGEDIRIQPKSRPEPAWKTNSSEGTPVPSILDREPTSAGPGRVTKPATRTVSEEPAPVSQPEADVAQPSAESRAASDAAFAKRYPNEEMQSGMSPDAERAWQESAGFKAEPIEDIGAKVRSKMPSVPRGGEASWPPEFEPSIQPVSKPQMSPEEDLAETRGIQERIRNAAEGEDRTRLSRAKKEWFARNAPDQTKGDLTAEWQKNLEYLKSRKNQPPAD